MKLIFVDKNPEIIEKIKELKMFQAYVGDIRDFKDKGAIVTCSNPNFTFGGGVDAIIKEMYPDECKQKQDKKGGNERIGNVIFTITVDKNIKSSKILVLNALKSILCLSNENENIVLTGLGTAIGGLSIDDFIEVLKDVFPNRAFKGFDEGLVCSPNGKDYKFKIGEVFTEKEAKLCNTGFHYCRNIQDIYKFYDRNSTICEIEILGEVDFGIEKECTTSIKILRELSEYEIANIDRNTGDQNTGDWNTGDWNTGHQNTGDRNTGDWNTGDWNTGHQNTGDRNTGDWNTGDWNTGDQNTGDWNTGHQNTGDRNTGHQNTGDRNTGDQNTGDRNTGDQNTGDQNTGDWNTGHQNTGDRNTGHQNTGDWNTGDQNTGCFNTETPFANFFDKPTKIKSGDYVFPNFFYFDITKWIYIDNMTPEERKEHPEADTLGGYLKKMEYKDAWRYAWNGASENEKKETLKLPNFNNKKFLEITGIDVKKELK